ncbi:alpha/beta-hydrolase [Obba rivulosa]|uniref:Alpha/beta-hydrolase n=1 Tax=Obba rivulosa TaxID=1052685 RepID=A0A8E2DTW6_9APHY|nr:alpha/beta-hydrolase [Obba rivulosa]
MSADISTSPDTAGSDIPTILDPSTCTRRGLCPVTTLKQEHSPLESHSLYFEQHGTGPEKIVFIMGLNATLFSWTQQVEYFGRKPEYSVLVFDNRGVGNSGSPRGPYTTGEMADDIVVLLDYVGWTAPRNIHVVGVSMGGMIAQELASKIPERIISLTLAATKAGGGSYWSMIPTWRSVVGTTRMLLTRDREARIPIALNDLFPQQWLDAKAPNDPQGRTNGEVQFEEFRRRIDVTRPQTPMGSVSQIAAALSHKVEPERLRKISASIPKVLIVTGDQDVIVDPSNSVYLKEHMPEAEYVEWETTGHGLMAQFPEKFNQLLERVFREVRERIHDS